MILDDILARTRADLETRKARVAQADVEAAARAAPRARGLASALRRPGRITCIAELKRRSPSAGWIREGADVVAIARSYAAAGASALSVLTDEPFFGGSLDDLRRVRAAVDLPLLRKDFMVDRYQVAEARAAGADAILIIVSALPDERIAELLDAAGELGLDALVETHDAAEVERAVRLGAQIIGVNNRDLKTFTMDRDLAARLRPQIPGGRVVIAESGIRDAADVQQMGRAGVDAVLVGETLMRAPDPGQALRALLEANG